MMASLRTGAFALLLLTAAIAGALALYLGVVAGANVNMTGECHGERNGQFTITITQYNVEGGVHCF